MMLSPIRVEGPTMTETVLDAAREKEAGTKEAGATEIVSDAASETEPGRDAMQNQAVWFLVLTACVASARPRLFRLSCSSFSAQNSPLDVRKVASRPTPRPAGGSSATKPLQNQAVWFLPVWFLL